MIVRPAEISDATEIGRLAAELGYGVEPAAVAVRLARFVDRPDHLLLVAEADGRLAGWVHALIWDLVLTGEFGVIAALVVDRGLRRRGVGRLLMRAAEDWMAGRGCAVVRLWSSIGRENAHGFYIQLGYTRIKTQYSFAKSIDGLGNADFGALIPQIGDPSR